MPLQSHVGALPAGLIDVFADAPLTGNPLAVVEDADLLTEAQMRRIAGEFNQAETTFIMRSNRADLKLRSFTAAGVEVAGAGHNALGAWLWMAEEGRLGPIDEPRVFQQEIGNEILPIVLHAAGGRIFGKMRQSPLQLFPPLGDIDALAAALRLGVGDIANSPPPRPAGTGATHLLVRLRDRTAVDRAEPLPAELVAVLGTTAAEGCYVYAHDAANPGTAYARFFNPTVGLWEDAATGTAAGPLAAYLAHEGLIEEALEIEQGTKMGRRSILRVNLVPEPELGGAGIVVLRGTLVV